MDARVAAQLPAFGRARPLRRWWRRPRLWTVVCLAALLAVASPIGAQPGSPPRDCPHCGGHGGLGGHPGGGLGPGGPPSDDPRGANRMGDGQLFHALLANRDQIRRSVVDLPDGIETVTESDSPEIAEKIVQHVRSMARRLEEGRPIHLRDPLFAEIFRHADDIHIEIEETGKGAHVRETSEDPYVAKLIQAHAAVVSAFLANGWAEVRRDHPLPAR